MLAAMQDKLPPEQIRPEAPVKAPVSPAPRRDEEHEKRLRVERRRALDAINNAGAPPEGSGSTRMKVRWAVNIVESIGLPLNKQGFRELQKRTHPDKQVVGADRTDAHRAFQRLGHVEEGLRSGRYL